MLEIQHATLGYKVNKRDKVVLKDFSMTVETGELLCILGANGVGKTTMYKTILGFLPLLDGQIMIDGKDIKELSSIEMAKLIAYVPQYHNPPFPYSVSDVVLMGRNAHLGQFQAPGKEDVKIAEEMMEKVGILRLKDEIYTEVSGGERQLVLIARALTQQAKYMLMDEPTSNLDYGNQMRLLTTIKELAKEGVGICFTSHYPEHAFLTEANVLAVLKDRPALKGKPSEIITSELLKDMYGLDGTVKKVLNNEGKEQDTVLISL